jgi:SAM-dependent methyltransferase
MMQWIFSALSADARREADVMQLPAHHQAARQTYDTVAEDYAAKFRDELAYKPLDRALLGVVVEAAGDGAIADLGCGPGHVTGWLSTQGAAAVGIDLSPGMIDVARREHPELEFRVGDLLDLPAADGEFGAAVALYSVIHLTPEELTPAFAEMGRTLRPGGVALVSFHVGRELRRVTEFLGHPVEADFQFLEPGPVVAQMEAVGLAVEAQLERSSYPDEVETRRAYVLARNRG